MSDMPHAWTARVMNAGVIDSLSLWCGCTADVQRDPTTGKTDYRSPPATASPTGRNTVVDSVTESIFEREKKIGK